MSVKIAIECSSPELGLGRVEIECHAIPHDAFIPLALSKLGKDDERMAKLLSDIISNMEFEDDDESEDGPQ